MNFVSGKELLKICESENLSIAEVMKKREISEGVLSEEQMNKKMQEVLAIMKNSAKNPMVHPQKSMSGTIGGEADKIYRYQEKRADTKNRLMSRIITYSMAVIEVNASMGVIVAAPTAGSAGVLPGTLIALQEEYEYSDVEICNALYNASAIGYLLMRNASVAGAEAGCQAEVGSASAMAASAVTELMGGTPSMCLSAAAMAIANLLGLVCDPVAGLVEVPCQSRNVTGALNAFSCAQIALSGIQFQIPFDEMADAMLRVGRGIPFELRETAIGGCAGTKTGCQIKCGR